MSREFMEDLAFGPATAIAKSLRAGEVRAVQMLEYFFERIDRLNPALNAVVFEQREAALAAAHGADVALARGEVWGPLHGVPMTIKESFDWVGSPSTRGNEKFRNYYPACDAIAIRRLKAAGAVIFGKTNVPKDLQDWQTFNSIYGTTNNPWNVAKVPGGSSGGSAAALAAGLTGLEFGSDIGASIRNPAHYCGVYGHKPSYGIVPWQGAQLPDSHLPSELSVVGPMARSADDLRTVLEIVAGAAAPAEPGWTLNLPPCRKADIKDFRVGVLLAHPECRQDSALTDVLAQAVERLRQAGVRIDAGVHPRIDLSRAHRIYLLSMRAATGARLDDATYADWLRQKEHLQAADWSYRAYVLRAAAITHREWWNLQNERHEMMAAWRRFFEQYDVLLAPSAASATFDHDQAGERADRRIRVNGGLEPVTDQLAWAGLASLPNLPATAMPAGRTRDGLPCGFQVIGGAYRDFDCLRFAELAAAVLGGFCRPPL